MMKMHKNLVLFVALLLVLAIGPLGWTQNDGSNITIEPIQHSMPAAFPPIGEFEVLRGDFHIHTFHSDGQQTPKQRIFEAWRYGYDAIAITDHGNYHGYEEAAPWADALGLVLLRGIETGIQGHEHIVALGLDDAYTPRNAHNWAETPDAEQAYYREQLEQLTDAGAISLYAHPHVGLREPVEWAIKEGHIIGVEVKNAVCGSGWGTVNSHGTWCYPFAFDWALEHNLALFANSDVHGDRDETDQPVTLVFVTERSPEGIMEAFRDRRTVAWFDGMLWGREDLLTELVSHLITVEAIEGPQEEQGWLQFHNHGPVPFDIRISQTEAELEPVHIPAYGKALVASSAGEQISVRWDNAWVTSDDTLVTIHSVVKK